ncbi:MAG: peptide chain release factor aRF-1 [Thermoproteota archaeon]|jgi:Peptide chain release factor 1 (eRF1)
MSDLSSGELIKLRRLIKELKSKEGRGTELISLYIPAGRQIADIMDVLKSEYSQAGNIKDRTTRHHVQESLVSIMQRLKFFNKASGNGLIVFAGYVAGDAPGNEKFEIYLIEPPKPISTYLYRCDSRFHVEILEEMLKVGNKYGLVVIDREEASFAILEGSNLNIIETITSGIPGKHRAGGQSARRFERVIEIMAHEFYKRIGERMVKYYLQDNKVDGLVVGGPGPTKNDFLDGDYIPGDLKKLIVGVVDLGYSGEEGVYELLQKGRELFQKVELVKQREEVDNFLKLLNEDPKRLAIGVKEVIEAINQKNLSKLIIVEDVSITKIEYLCLNCNNMNQLVSGNEPLLKIKQSLKCNYCGSENVKIISQTDITDELVDKSMEIGADVIYLSKNIGESESIKSNFQGIIGILKY